MRSIKEIVLKSACGLKRIDKRNLILAAGLPIVLIILWQSSSEKGLINSAILPSPLKILTTWDVYIKNGKYFEYFCISMQRFLFGFFFGTVFGLTVGTITGLFPRINAALTVIIGVARCVPNVAWIPICIMTLGISEPAKIVLIMIGCFWSVFINTEGGIRGIDPKYLEVARLLGKNRITCIFRVILPAAFPSILMGIREGFGNAWKGIAVAELIASSSGLGFMIAYSREIARPDVMFIGLMSIGGVGLILDILIKGIQKKILQ